MSKGSNPRPVDKEEYDKNFDRIFGKKPLTSLTNETEDTDRKTKPVRQNS